MRVRGYPPGTPCWAELASPDPPAAVDFYRQLFGWQATTVHRADTHFTLRGLAVAGLAPARKRSAWRAYIACDDTDASVAAAIEAGGRVISAPVNVGDLGRSALVADADGAVFGLWRRGTFAGAEVANEPAATCWTEVATRDPAGATAFYGKVFGWVGQPGQMPMVFDYREWQVGNRVVGGLVPMGSYFPPDVPPHWRITVEVDDCAATAQRCTDLGGQVFLGPMDLGIGQFAQLFDPQGAAVGVIELLPELRLDP